MRLGNRFRWYRVGVGVVVVSATVAFARPDAVAHAGLDFWNLPTLNQEIEEGAAAGEALEQASLATKNRIAIKDQIVRDLVDGDIDLPQAADRFRTLNTGYADYLSILHRLYPGGTDAECVYRNVIEYTAALIENRPDKREILQRLEAEYARFRQSQTQIGT